MYVVKAILLIVGILILSGIVGFYVVNKEKLPVQSISKTAPDSISTDAPTIEVVAQGLDTPWALAFLPGGDILVTERPGNVRLVTNGQLQSAPIATLPQVKEIGEGGLLGIDIDPDFTNNHFVYLYYTYADNQGDTLNRVVKMTFENNTLTQEKILVDAIPGSSNHNGGRIKFGPDGYLYITTGDAENPSQAQSTNSLAGKILRVDTNGKAAPGNPFGNRVYSYGHRNPQGLVWTESQSSGETPQLISTEHGRSIPVSGLDEINVIQPGKNYGWPEIQGDEKKAGMQTPDINSGSSTWAPADIALINGELFFAGLRGKALYRTDLETKKIDEYFKNEYGRIREVIVGTNGLLYITTSNKDGRGVPLTGDDKIIRLNPSKL